MELFPKKATRLKHDILYAIYTDPFITQQEIANRTNTSQTMKVQAIVLVIPNEANRSRVKLFTRLGYIKVPPVDQTSSLLPNYLKQIIRAWRYDPGATDKEIADYLGIAKRSVYSFNRQIYSHFGYKPNKSIPDQFARLYFFWYMSWFDKPRLNLEARIAYRKLYGQVRT